jgi:hypothetical protein
MAPGIDLLQLPPEVRMHKVRVSEEGVVFRATIHHHARIGAQVVLTLDVLRLGRSV